MAEEDLIFGKNRHFFGGIEPSNMKEFTTNSLNEVVSITATLPDDTVINNQILCSVAGAVIRRKRNGFPKDEFDGDLVIDIKNSISFIDNEVNYTDRWYYSAFPYTTQGVYNRNVANRSAINAQPMSIRASSNSTTSIRLIYSIPDGWVGVVVRRDTNKFPETETDGDAIGTFTTDGSYEDTDVIPGVTYFYSFFLYDINGDYLYDERNRISSTVLSDNYLYGYDLQTNNIDPSSRVSYPIDVDNYGYTPVKVDFSNDGSFNPGSWYLVPGTRFMPKPCMLRYDGTVDYYLNPNDYTQKEDGTASGVANIGFGGNAMMEWPKIYTKRWEEDEIYHFRCSNKKYDDTWDCWCNYDINDNEIDHFYTPIYNGFLDSANRLRSISGQTPSMIEGTKEIEGATANGSDWYTEVLADRLLIQDLIVLLGKSTDGQNVFGNGKAMDWNLTTPTGMLDKKGLFWGSNDETNFVKVFGIENFWGYAQRRIAGWITTNDERQLVKITRGTHDGSGASDYNVTGLDYLNPCKVPTSTSSKTSGYINSMFTADYGRLPIGIDGSASTYECDVSGWIDRTGKWNENYAIVGSSGGLSSGPFSATLWWDITRTMGGMEEPINASVSCKPRKK